MLDSIGSDRLLRLGEQRELKSGPSIVNSQVQIPSLSVVIPMYNEVVNVSPMLDSVHDALASYPAPWELVVVDDGSTDGTADKLEEQAAKHGQHVVIVRLRRNFGQTAAMQTGFEAARGELIATLDGDLQNDPKDIPGMVRQLVERNLDMLCGWRKSRQDESVRKLFSRVANRLIARVTGVRIHDYGCSLKVYRSNVMKDIVLFGEMHRFIPVWVANVTDPSRIGEVVVNHHPRQFGSSKYGLSRTFRVILDLLSAFFFLHYRTKPAHFFGTIGLLLGTVGGFILIYLAIVKLVFGEAIGTRPLLFVGILFVLGSLQFLTTGILAEMLSRTFFASSDITPHPTIKRPPPSDSDWHLPTKQEAE
jgi:glycosyltransferase involved in cell wall biosynthesis